MCKKVSGEAAQLDFSSIHNTYQFLIDMERGAAGALLILDGGLLSCPADCTGAERSYELERRSARASPKHGTNVESDDGEQALDDAGRDP